MKTVLNNFPGTEQVMAGLLSQLGVGGNPFHTAVGQRIGWLIYLNILMLLLVAECCNNWKYFHS